MLSTARKLVRFLDGRSRVQMLVLFVPMLATALLEMLSIGLILPLAHALVAPGQGGRLATVFERFLPARPADELLMWVAVVFGAVFVLKNVALFAMTYLINIVIMKKLAQFAQRMFALYLRRPFTFHLQRHSAETMRNLNQSTGYAFDGLRLLMMIALETILIAATCVLLLVVEPVVTLAAGGLLVAFGLAFHRVSGPVFHRWGARAHALERVVIQSIAQALVSIRDVKLYDCYQYLVGAFARLTNELARNKANGDMARHIPRLVIETLVIVGFVAVVLYLSRERTRVEDIVGTLALFGMASLRLMPSANRLLISLSELKLRRAAIDDLHRDLVEGAADADDGRAPAGAPPLRFDREIRLDRVSFAYPSSGVPILQDVSLSIAKGESIGFVGPSGAGKTTLLNIVLGLLPPDSGRLLVDGADVRVRVRDWQRHIGFVPQNLFLIDETLKRNIAFGLRDEDINEARIAKVVKLARLDGVVAQLRHGLDTPLGEFGSRLSGGQQQRIAIARALYRDPDVLVLDEATAALDGETEREVTHAIESLAGEKTVLIIAHRLSTVQRCDRIVLLDRGRVAGIGSFAELLADSPDFRRLVQLSALEVGAEPAFSDARPDRLTSSFPRKRESRGTSTSLALDPRFRGGDDSEGTPA